MKLNKDTDWDLLKLSDEKLASLTLEELQRVRNKRWAHSAHELIDRANAEIARRNPKTDWSCLRCGKDKFHEKEIRVSGGFLESFWGWERNRYHAIVCNYCGKTEFYNVQMSGAEKGIGFFGN